MAPIFPEQDAKAVPCSLYPPAQAWQHLLSDGIPSCPPLCPRQHTHWSCVPASRSLHIPEPQSGSFFRRSPVSSLPKCWVLFEAFPISLPPHAAPPPHQVSFTSFSGATPCEPAHVGVVCPPHRRLRVHSAHKQPETLWAFNQYLVGSLELRGARFREKRTPWRYHAPWHKMPQCV